MAQIELQTTQNQAGSYLPNGAHLYTALVYSHRSAGYLFRGQTTAAFLGLRLKGSELLFVGRNAGYISRTYFANAISPHELLRRYTLFGFIHLALDEEEVIYEEERLILGMNKRFHLKVKAAKDVLSWCKHCADEERESYGVTSWKTVHQLTSVRICHIHGNPLLLRCNKCGIAPGDLRSFRLPGEVCLRCGRSDFEEDKIVVTDAYRTFVRDIAFAFENQENFYRDGAWFSLLSKFISAFPSRSDAEKTVVEYLCREWRVSSVEEVWGSLQISWPSCEGIFEKGRHSLSVRVLLHRVMRAILSSLLTDDSEPRACQRVD